MPSKNPAQRLADIRENIEAINQFVAGLTLSGFSADRKTVYAVTRGLEIISEAARRLPDDLKNRHPSIDWTAIAASGNVYRHEYEVVDKTLLWQTIQRELPVLLDAVAKELKRLDSGV